MAIPACSVRMSLTGAALAVAALAVAGCGPSSSASPPAAPVSSAGAAGGASSSGGTVASSPSPGSGGSGSGVPACTTAHLSASAVDTQGAAGTDYTTIDLTNTGGTSYTLYGFPGVSLANSGGPIGASATRSGSPSLVTLAPGAKANAVLGVVNAENYPSGKCSPDSASFLLIYPPNQTEALDLPFRSTGCANKSVTLLTIRPMAPGAHNANS